MSILKYFRNILNRIKAPRRYYVSVLLEEKITGDRFGPAVFTINAKSKAEAKERVKQSLTIIVDDCWPMKETVNGVKR